MTIGQDSIGWRAGDRAVYRSVSPTGRVTTRLIQVLLEIGTVRTRRSSTSGIPSTAGRRTEPGGPTVAAPHGRASAQSSSGDAGRRSVLPSGAALRRHSSVLSTNCVSDELHSDVLRHPCTLLLNLILDLPARCGESR